MAQRGLHTFRLIWAGQLASLVGSGMGRFALGVWVYEQRGSATEFALVMVAATLPLVLVWPVAGALADRWGRREVMILGDAGAGLASTALLLLFGLGHLEVGHVYVAVAASAACEAFQWPAYAAAIPLLVSKQHLGRANGLVELAGGGAQVLAPLLGGAVLALYGLKAVLLLDLAGFCFALGTLLAVRIPAPAARLPAARLRLLPDLREGWRFIRSRPGLSTLLLFFVVTNFTCAIPQVLVQPLVLSFASEAVLGAVLSCAGIGMVVGGLVVSTWAGPKQPVRCLLAATALQGVFLLTAGLRPNAVLIAAAGFGYGLLLPLITAPNQTLWQRKVPGPKLGRVVALRRAASGLSYPAAFLLAGPLADHVFEPLLAPAGPLAETLSSLLGTGPGRGMGLLIVLAGGLTVLLTAAFSLHPRLRHLEKEVPDAVVDVPEETGALRRLVQPDPSEG